MNAYELADELEGWCDDVLSNQNRKNVFKKHAKMLRQQADRIAELEKQTFFIADPEKQGEPVAWMDEHENVIFEKNWAYPIPLYTSLVFCTAPQTKPLSDEEIAKEWSKFYPDVFHTHLIDFVRAIEERHGIK